MTYNLCNLKKDYLRTAAVSISRRLSSSITQVEMCCSYFAVNLHNHQHRLTNVPWRVSSCCLHHLIGNYSETGGTLATALGGAGTATGRGSSRRAMGGSSRFGSGWSWRSLGDWYVLGAEQLLLAKLLDKKGP